MDRSRPYIACFDLATAVGVAHGIAGGRPMLETWDLKGGGERPGKLAMLDDMLERFIADNPIDRMFYEQPLPIAVLMKIGATEATIQFMRSLAAVVEDASSRHDLMVGSWQVLQARQAVTGRGRWRKGEAKKQVMAFCRLIGYAPKNDNEGDALIGFLYESALLAPRLAHLSTPLFSTAR